MTQDQKSNWKSFTEEIDVAGHQLVAEITRLLAEGNIRRLQIRSEKGDVFLAVPLAAGAVAGGVVFITAPWLAVIAAIAGLVAKVKLEVVRELPAQAGDTRQKDTGQAPLGGD
jgi:phage terminase large subunit-like protein